MCAPQSKHDYSLYRAPATRAINERVSGNERVSARALSLPLPLSLSLSVQPVGGAHSESEKKLFKIASQKKNELKICVFLCCLTTFFLSSVIKSFFLSFFFLSLFPFSANGTFNNNYYTRVHTHTHARRKKEKKKKKKKEEKIILIWWLVSSLRPLSTPCPSLDA